MDYKDFKDREPLRIGDLVKISDDVLLLIAEREKEKSNRLLGIVVGIDYGEVDDGDSFDFSGKARVAWNDRHPPTMENIYDLELISTSKQ